LDTSVAFFAPSAATLSIHRFSVPLPTSLVNELTGKTGPFVTHN
jgi:hypothetical protein